MTIRPNLHLTSRLIASLFFLVLGWFFLSFGSATFALAAIVPVFWLAIPVYVASLAWLLGSMFCLICLVMSWTVRPS